MTGPGRIWTNGLGSYGEYAGFIGTEYIRADLVKALVEAAQNYRDAINAFDGTGGMTTKIARLQAWSGALDAALAAFTPDGGADG
jgi:hypothetical protein